MISLLPKPLMLSLAALGLIAVTHIVQAQQDRPSVSAPTVIEEVLVNARRRNEPVQQVPMAVTAFSGYLLEQMNIDDVSGLSLFSPGFTVSNYNLATPQFYMRGIGSNTSGAADDSSVAVFVDDVYIARAGFFDSDLFGVESIEVLRGPQGTLYGKNAIGGVVRIANKAPGTEDEIKVGVSVGDLNRQDFQLYANTELMQGWAANIALSSRQRDGYVENSVTGKDERDEDSQSFRGQLRWVADDSLDLRLILDASAVDVLGNGRGLAGDVLLGLLDTPSRNQYAKTDSPVEGYTESNDQGVSLHVNYRLQAHKLTSITAYRDSDYEFVDEFLPVSTTPVLVNSADEKAEQISQELRLSNIDTAAHSYVAGVYFLQEDVERKESFDGSGVAAFFGFPASLIPLANNRFEAENTTTSYALFVDYDMYLQPDMTLSIGARYTDESKDFQSSATGADLLGFGVLTEAYSGVDEKESWEDISPRLSLRYQLKDDQMIYLSASQGFKSGAFNSLASNPEAAINPVDQESATQWEIGYKSYWFDQSLLFNGTVFYVDYKDLQVFQISQGVITVENAASAISQGVEFELLGRPSESWELAATYSYLDASYEDYVDANGTDLSGNDLMRSPEHSWSTSVTYSHTLEYGEVDFRVDYVFRDEMFFLADNSDLSLADDYGLVNARIGFDSADKHWSASIWGRNILDEEYYVFVVPVATTQSVIPGEPATYGVTVNFYY